MSKNWIKRESAIGYLIPALLFAATGYWLWQGIFRRHPEARHQIRYFMQRVNPGDTKTQAQSKFKSGSYEKLTLRSNPDDNIWSIDTPFEFGAGNWILYLEFDNDKVAAIRLRIADSMQIRPKDSAPPDKISSGYHSSYFTK